MFDFLIFIRLRESFPSSPVPEKETLEKTDNSTVNLR